MERRGEQPRQLGRAAEPPSASVLPAVPCPWAVPTCTLPSGEHLARLAEQRKTRFQSCSKGFGLHQPHRPGQGHGSELGWGHMALKGRGGTAQPGHEPMSQVQSLRFVGRGQPWGWCPMGSSCSSPGTAPPCPWQPRSCCAHSSTKELLPFAWERTGGARGALDWHCWP